MSLIPSGLAKGGVTSFYPKTIEGSLRFNDDDTAYLSWTPDSAGDRKTWTWSGWVKLGNLTINRTLMAARIGTNNEDTLQILLTSSDKFNIGGYSYGLNGDPLLRDPSAWYHIVIAYDTTQTTDSNRIKTYINGTQITLVGTFPPLNLNGAINNTQEHNIGRRPTVNDRYLDGYLAEVHFLNGIAATPDDFGELKNGVWVAKTYEGDYDSAAQVTAGNLNGFHLTFQDDAEVEAFNTVLYNGTNGVGGSVTGVGFKPDLIWVKSRSAVRSHVISDSVRGTNANLFPDLTNAESTASTGIQSFDSDGFTYGTTAPLSDGSLVAWCWKAGGAPTVDNSAGAGNVPTAGSVKIDGVNSTSALAGSLPATRLSASTTYGLSIVSYSGSGGDATIAHELGAVPSMIMFKNRTTDRYWLVHHKDIPLGTNSELQYAILNDAVAPEEIGTGEFMQGTLPTSTVFSVHNNLGYNSSSNNYIAYCWAEKTGYSKFGTYTGNGLSAGPIIYTTDDGTAGGANGFNPACLIVKEYDNNTTDGDTNTASGNWFIWDNTRDTDGVFNTNIHPNLANAEAASGSNFVTPNNIGFQLTGTGAETNGSGRRYIYAAFADTREAAFWLDQSGNDNDWQPVNLDHNDTVSDSPTDNHATLNPLDLKTGTTLSDGNLVRTDSVEAWESTVSTMAVSSGKYYVEFTPLAVGATVNIMVGVVQTGFQCNVSDSRFWASFDGHSYHAVDGNKVINGSGSSVSYGDSWTVDDVIGVALDLDAGEIEFYKNGVSQGVANTGLSGTYHFACASYQNGTKLECNFGQQPFKYGPPE